MTSRQDQVADEVSDDEIAVRILDKEELGLRQLLVKHGKKVKSFLRWKYGGQLDDEDRTDVLHQVAYRAWKYMGSFDDKRGSLGAWLVGIAQNEAIDFLQRERLPVGDLEHDPTAADDDDTKLDPERRKLFEDLDRILEELPRMQQLVAKEDLRSGGEADGPALAKKLGKTANAVRVARSKARRTIAEKLRALGHCMRGDA